MIGKLRGQIDSVDEGTVIIDVAGVGYQVRVTAGELDRIGGVGEEVILYIHTHVREDALELFGFRSRRELQVFQMLVGVSGVGPRMAMDTLSALDPADFLRAVGSADIAVLTQVSGVGRKTAERLVLELQDRVGGIDLTPAAAEDAGGDAPVEEAAEALQALGYNRAEAVRAVRRVVRGAAETDIDVQDLIRLALRELSGEGGMS